MLYIDIYATRLTTRRGREKYENGLIGCLGKRSEGYVFTDIDTVIAEGCDDGGECSRQIV